MDVYEPEQSRPEHGCSLVGLLMVIVLLGMLSATAVVGVSSMTGTGGDGSSVDSGIGKVIERSTGNVCTATAGVARSASASYFLNSGDRSYPAKWSDMTSLKHSIYKPAANVRINSGNPKELDGPGWKLIMSGGGVNEPTFTCR